MPQITSTQAVLDSLARMRRREAEAKHAQYPQYVGHWDGWRIAEITRTVRTKLGTAFEAGDLVLVSTTVREERIPPTGRGSAGTPYADWPVKRFATAYSYRNGIDTSIPVEHLAEIVVTPEPATS